jgi:hypothetical protein
MEHKFVNSGRMNLIVSDLERYNVGLLESEIILRNIHEFSTQEAINPGTLFSGALFLPHSMGGRVNMCHIFHLEHAQILLRYIWRYHKMLEGV